MSARSSEFDMTPSVQKDCSRRGLSKNRTNSAAIVTPDRPKTLSAQDVPKCLTRTRAQQPNQEGNSIEGLRSRWLNARKLPFEVARKVRGEPGSEITDQSLTGDLGEHSPQAVADRKLDTRRSALFNRYETIVNLALRGRPAALIAACSDDPTRQVFEVALDTRGATEIR